MSANRGYSSNGICQNATNTSSGTHETCAAGVCLNHIYVFCKHREKHGEIAAVEEMRQLDRKASAFFSKVRKRKAEGIIGGDVQKPEKGR